MLVTTPAGTSAANSLFTYAGALNVTSLSAPGGAPGDVITVSGAGLSGVNAVTVGGTPAEFAKFLKKDHERWARVIKAAGVKAE